jgi:putative nucleotidyltransferase with HDIG domain
MADSAAVGRGESGKLLLDAFVLGVTVAGLILAVVGVWLWSSEPLAALLVLMLITAAAERFDVSLYGDSRVSVSFVPMFAAVLLGGVSGLLLVVPAAVIASAVGVGRPLHKIFFNFGCLMVAGAASALVLEAGTLGHLSEFPLVIGPVVAAAATHFLVNATLVGQVIALASRSSFRSVWAEHFTWLWPHYLVLGFLALAIALAYREMGLWGIAVFLAPPVMMRLSIKQYIDRTSKGVIELREAHAELKTAHHRLDRAYDGTLRSLVAALDARDSETGGHSERVADLTSAIAERMGISRDSEYGRYLQWGALLHDVGKIAVSDLILRKPGKLSEEEWEVMRTHAAAGYQIVRNVEFLAPAAEIVLAHHERFDGRGYPRGLAGEQIPLGSRIFAIADTFDAITSERPYKSAISAEDALAEILRCSGTQFDPAVVKAFLMVYQERFVHLTSSRKNASELSEALKNAILEAAGMENLK